MAIFLGPYGVGLISQLNNFNLILSNITSFGMNVGIVKYVADYNEKNKRNEIHRLVITVFSVGVISVTIFVIIGIFFSKKITGFILGDEKFSNYLIIVLIGLPFLVLFNFIRSFFRGLLQIKIYVLIGLFSYGLGLLILIPLILIFKLEGAVWHLCLYSTGYFIIAFFFFKRNYYNKLNHIQQENKIDFSILKQLFKFGMASLIAGTSTLLSLLLVRTLIVKHMGILQLGIFQAVFAISGQSIMIIIESIGTYSFPRISGLTSYNDIRNEINKTFRLAVLISTPIISIILILKNIIILILYSAQFSEASSILGIQLLGDFFKAVGWSMGVALLPLERLKAFMAIDVGWSLLFVSISYITIPRWGLHGVVASYLVCFMLHALVNYIYLRSTIGFCLWDKNLKLIFSSIGFIGIGVIFFQQSLWFYIVMGLLLTGWLKIVVTREEVDFGIEIVKKMFLKSSSRLKKY